ncbi:MAG: glycosyltransferase family 4 protein [Promethearchaeota archaeon]
MKIAEVVSSFYPNVGGIENAVCFLSKELAKLGHEVHVITLNGKTTRETINEIHIHRLRPLIHPPLLPQKQFDIACMCRCEDFDVVHIHSTEPICLQHFLISKYLAGKPTIVTLFSIGGWTHHPRPPIRITAGPYERLALKLLKKADILHVKNERDKAALIKLGFNTRRIHLIPDGVLRYAFGDFDGDAFRRKYGLGEKKIVLYVGRLHHAKGIRILVRAMSKVVKRKSDAVAVLVGKDVDMRAKIVSEANSLGIQDNIVMTGYISEKEKFQAYSACNVLVLPSLYDLVEAYSIVISEAWAQKKPVIASAIGAIPHRIKHGVNGLLVPPGNPETLAESILHILRNPEKAKALGNNSHKNVATWSEVAKRFEKAFITASRR